MKELINNGKDKAPNPKRTSSLLIFSALLSKLAITNEPTVVSNVPAPYPKRKAITII